MIKKTLCQICQINKEGDYCTPYCKALFKIYDEEKLLVQNLPKMQNLDMFYEWILLKKEIQSLEYATPELIYESGYEPTGRETINDKHLTIPVNEDVPKLYSREGYLYSKLDSHKEIRSKLWTLLEHPSKEIITEILVKKIVRYYYRRFYYVKR